MHYDPKDPHNPANDKFILSKGHAAPIYYAAWAEAGNFPVEDLKNLRKISSDLEGHPTPRLSFCDVATGSLGQVIDKIFKYFRVLAFHVVQLTAQNISTISTTNIFAC